MSRHDAPIPTEPVPNPEDPGTFVPVRGEGEQDTWFTRNAKRIVAVSCILAVLLLLLDLAYTKHSYSQIEDLFGFYGLFGFAASVTLVLLAKLLRVLVKRPEDYYDE